MGHDNIDKEIKKKLEGRLLEPSITAWEKLDNLLEKEEKKTKKVIPFYWVAASILVILGVFFTFQRNINNDSLIVEPIVVETGKDKKNSKDKEQLSLQKQEFVGQEQVLEQTAEVVVKIGKKAKRVEQFIKNKKEELPTAYDINDLEIKKQEVLLAEKVHKDNQDKKSNYDLDFEVDSLLAVATATIDQKKEKLPEVINTTIDANALLADVEEELDMSFKEKVFKKIKSGFKKTKTAVAKRND